MRLAVVNRAAAEFNGGGRINGDFRWFKDKAQVIAMTPGPFRFAVTAWIIGLLVPWLQAAEPAQPAKATAASTPSKILRLADFLVQSLDRNADKRLDADEWARLGTKQPLPDADADRSADSRELAEWLAKGARGKRLWLGAVSASGRTIPAGETAAPRRAADAPVPAAAKPLPPRPSKRFVVAEESLPSGLPDWFRSRDGDGDGQLTLSEYAPRAAAAEVREFTSWDRDGDGVVTASEYLDRGGARSP